MSNKIRFGFVRETEKMALKEDVDVTGIPRTGLETYLRYIFPNVNDWAHNKQFPGKKTRPDYRSDTLKMVVEFDGLPHFRDRAAFEKDSVNTKNYKNAGYKVVRIPLYLNLTTSVINNLFDVNLTQPFFEANVSPFNENFQPNCFCMTGLKRMADDYLKYAQEQIPIMMESIKEMSPIEYDYLKTLGL